jgi:transcriptional regulator with XRE-family HTH domain
MVVIPEGVDPVTRQRIQWGQNIQELLEQRSWTRKKFLLLLHEQYGIEASESSLAMWLKGEVCPRPDVQAAIAGVAGIPHHMLFPPVQLPRRVRSVA